MNLTLATPIPSITVVPGEVLEIDFHVHEVGGNNFNWTGYTPKAKLTVADKSVTVTGSVVSAGGGTATTSFTATQTATLAGPSWGEVVLYADPTAGSENLHIATIALRVTSEVIP
jgi:hypothetical protein